MTPGVNTWTPEHGDCRSWWREFKSKSSRDFAASQAHKTPGYLSHRVGEYERREGPSPYQRCHITMFTLIVYLKPKATP